MGLRRISRRVRFNSLGINATGGVVVLHRVTAVAAYLACHATPAIYYYVVGNYSAARVIVSVCNATLARLPGDFTRATEPSEEN